MMFPMPLAALSDCNAQVHGYEPVRRVTHATCNTSVTLALHFCDGRVCLGK